MNKIEEVKRQKDGLEIFEDIYRFAELGTQAISPDDETLLKWYGIYTQRPAEDGYFMVRLRIPGGDLTSTQLREIANLSRLYGRSLADITVRQNFQFHWVRVENLPHILDTLHAIGLSTTESCGDCVRNIINCPVSGFDGDELYDALPLITQVNDFLVGSRYFSHRPPKFKVATT